MNADASILALTITRKDGLGSPAMRIDRGVERSNARSCWLTGDRVEKLGMMEDSCWLGMTGDREASGRVFV